MDIIDNILQQIAYSIASNEYIWTDIEKVALIGSCSTDSGWDELLVTANAFLNTNGGAIIIGIVDDENNNMFSFTGVDASTQQQLGFISSAFANAAHLPINLESHFSFTLKPFQDGQVMAVSVLPLTDAEKYVYYQHTAWQRLITGNARIQGHTLATSKTPNGSAVFTAAGLPAAGSDAIEENATEPQPANPEPEAPAFQKIYSGELINLFGSDYISLEPDYKQLLSYIYEKNNEAEAHYPNPTEICSRLWALRGEVGTATAFELYALKVKKIIAQMEKTRFIIKQNSKAEYRVNTSYEVVKNLFN